MSITKCELCIVRIALVLTRSKTHGLALVPGSATRNLSGFRKHFHAGYRAWDLDWAVRCFRFAAAAAALSNLTTAGLYILGDLHGIETPLFSGQRPKSMPAPCKIGVACAVMLFAKVPCASTFAGVYPGVYCFVADRDIAACLQ
jgi:hypothetical protein